MASIEQKRAALRAALQKAFEESKAQVAGLPAKTKSPVAEAQAAKFIDIGDLGDKFCDVAPKAVDGMIDLIHDWSWVIPDKIEKPGLVVLMTLDKVLPELCALLSDDA